MILFNNNKKEGRVESQVKRSSQKPQLFPYSDASIMLSSSVTSKCCSN